MAYAWERLVNGTFVQSDLRLLLHEYTELMFLSESKSIFGKQITIREAHNLANKIHDWQNNI